MAEPPLVLADLLAEGGELDPPEELAERSGVGVATIARIEAG
jgi:transcriptional regulator with XRE-family HTH domain